MDAPLLSPPSLLLLQLHTCTHRLNYIRTLPCLFSLFTFFLAIKLLCAPVTLRSTRCILPIHIPMKVSFFFVILTSNSAEYSQVFGWVFVFKDFGQLFPQELFLWLFVSSITQMFWNPAAPDGKYCFISQNTAQLCCKHNQFKVS